MQPSRRRQAVDRPRDTSPPSFFDIFQFGISPTQNRQYNFYDCISLSLSLPSLFLSLWFVCASDGAVFSQNDPSHSMKFSSSLLSFSLSLTRMKFSFSFSYLTSVSPLVYFFGVLFFILYGQIQSQQSCASYRQIAFQCSSGFGTT